MDLLGGAVNLYEFIKPKFNLSQLVLPPAVTAQIEECMEDHKYQAALLENGLHVRKKILHRLCGLT